MRAYQAAANAHDLEATLSMIAQDAIFLLATRLRILARMPFEGRFRPTSDTIKNEKYRTHHVTWLLDANDFALPSRI